MQPLRYLDGVEDAWLSDLYRQHAPLLLTHLRANARSFVVLSFFTARYSLVALLLATGAFLIDCGLFLYVWVTLVQTPVSNLVLVTVAGALVTRAIWLAAFRFGVFTGLVAGIKSMLTIRKTCREVEAEAETFRGRLLCFQV